MDGIPTGCNEMFWYLNEEESIVNASLCLENQLISLQVRSDSQSYSCDDRHGIDWF